jgi:predicted MFS family arabinose efflux permease
MANAGGRLAGTVLSGWVYQSAGLTGCLWWSTAFVLIAALLSLRLPDAQQWQRERRKNSLVSASKPDHLTGRDA